MAAAARKALVTGASGGLGTAIARDLAADHHVLLGGRSADSLATLAAELPASTPWLADLTDSATVRSRCAEIDRLDVLVHNAGHFEMGAVAESTPDQWRTSMEVNFLAVVELTQLLLPALRAARGHVVLINSGAGLRANARWGSYAASKFALRAFADALRLEEPTLRVTSVHPGRIATPMQEAVVAAENKAAGGGPAYDPQRFLAPSTVAQAVGNAVRTPGDAHPTELMLRPIAR